MTSYLIAGCSRGIGLEITRQLSTLDNTAHVFAGARNPDGLPKDLADSPKIQPVKLDVTSSSDTAAVVKTIAKIINGSLDVLIINAGINITDFISGTSVEQLRETLETNTMAVHQLIQACLPLLRAGKAKKIIVLGALSGTFPVAQHLASQGLPGVGAYAVSKVAVHMMMMIYAAELASEGFLIASVHPGLVMTDMALKIMQRNPDVAKTAKKSEFRTITAEESAKGVIKVIEALKIADTGKLFSWEGEVLSF